MRHDTIAFFIELNGGNPNARTLLASTREGQIPEIPSEKGTLAAILEMLPKLLEKFSCIENPVKKVVTDIGAVTSDIKENPTLLFKGPKAKTAPPERSAPGHR